MRLFRWLTALQMGGKKQASVSSIQGCPKNDLDSLFTPVWATWIGQNNTFIALWIHDFATARGYALYNNKRGFMDPQKAGYAWQQNEPALAKERTDNKR